MTKQIETALLDDQILTSLRTARGIFQFFCEQIWNNVFAELTGMELYRELQNTLSYAKEAVGKIETRLDELDRDEILADHGIYPDACTVALWAFASHLVNDLKNGRRCSSFYYPGVCYEVTARPTNADDEAVGPRFWSFHCTQFQTGVLGDDSSDSDDSDDDVIMNAFEPLKKKSRPSSPEAEPLPDPEPDREPEDAILKDVLETGDNSRPRRESVSTKEILDELEKEAKEGELCPHHPEEPKPEEKKEEEDPVDVFCEIFGINKKD